MSNRVPYYEVNAFTKSLRGGNPAGVCVLREWPADEVLQVIAAQNNLSETAFLVKGPDNETWRLRWFTPTVEVNLCGHATLASAFVLLCELGVGSSSGSAPSDQVEFHSRSGPLAVRRVDGDLLELDFPATPTSECEIDDRLVHALGRRPIEVRSGEDYLVVYGHESDVRALQPDFVALKQLGGRGVIATAPGEGESSSFPSCDFVSRFFAPCAGIDEDPVTGSAHCALTPYWANRLGKTEMRAKQISTRGGDLRCCLDVVDGARVRIAGHAVMYLRGEIVMPMMSRCF